MTPRVWIAAVFAVYSVIFLVQVRCAPAMHSPLRGAPVLSEEQAITDMAPDAGIRPDELPAAPLPWQKAVPCDFGEHALNGACYMRWDADDMRPPCAPGNVMWKKRCYRPIAKPRPQPVSGE